MIAGVGPGLGASLARRFAKEGCRVALLARSGEVIEALSAELRRNGAQAAAVRTDLTEESQVRRAFEAVRSQLGPVDILVNHASGAGPSNRGALDTSPADFERAWRGSAWGALLCCQQAFPDMLKRGGGTILFTGATSSVRGSALAFSSAKFAVRGLAQALAREWWPRGIHVAHVVIDGIIGSAGLPGAGDEPLLDPDAIAATYWSLVTQDKSAWSLEVDVRPSREAFFE